MVNYSNGKIYKIEPIGGGGVGDVYIGSTTKEYLSQRMVEHRGFYRRWKNGKGGRITSYQLFDKFGVANCQITLLELVNATSKDELHARERHYIQSLSCVNRHVPLRTNSEYRLDNREQVLEQMRLYNQRNKEQMRLYKQRNKEQIRLYYHANRERLVEQQRLYRLRKKQKIAEESSIVAEGGGGGA